MPRYLFIADYSVEGAKGLLEKGGAARADVVAKTAESVGGRLESFDFAFGAHDAFVIVDLPDNAAAARVALTVSSAGGARVQTVVLLSADEIGGSGADVAYTAPGKG
ncbi:MAG: GYD domain-containing protein [Nocardioidaceae bacterium]